MSRAERRHDRDMRRADVGAKGWLAASRKAATAGIRLDGERERPRDIPEPGPPTSVEATEVLDIS
jgi:hypothetical protein